MTQFLRQLFIMTVYNPTQAASVLLDRAVPRDTAWSILALGVILNTLLYFLSTTLFPMPPEFTLPLLRSPVMVGTILGLVVFIFAFVFYWLGRVMGGQGTFDHILLMMGWLQFMRLFVQFSSLMLMLFLPGIAQLFVLGAGLYGAWIVVNFLNVAHQYDSLGKAVMLLMLTLFGLVIGMSIVLSVIGVTTVGLA